MRVFVCHASEDKPAVRQLVSRLHADGFDPWFDEERLLPGQDWEFEISAAVKRSDAVIVCLSAVSVEKVGYVQKELRRGFENRRACEFEESSGAAECVARKAGLGRRRPAAVHLGWRCVVYCPQCGVEYREGFTECADCHVPLLSGTPPAENDPFDPSLDLVVVLDTNDQIQLALVKGLFEEAGIPFYVLNQITTLVNDVDPLLRKRVKVQVPRDREAEARELLAALEAPVGAEEEMESGPAE